MKTGILAFLAFFVLLPFVSAAEINKDWLRHDETLSLDEISLKFDKSCVPGLDTRTLGLGVDIIRFLDANRDQLFVIDVGTGEGRYYLGEGWYANETWGNITACWANALSERSRIYCRIPDNSKYMELVCTTACNPINAEVFLNGQKFASFNLPANSGMRPLNLTLPGDFDRYLEYRLNEGGSLQISQVELIDNNGVITTRIPTVCELRAIGDSARFPAQVPQNVGDLAVVLNRPAIARSVLQVSINNASAIFLEIPAGADYADSTQKDALQRQADRKTRTSGWGEDFNARSSSMSFASDASQYPQVAYNGGKVSLSLPDKSSIMFAHLTLPQPLLISEYLYLSLKIKVSKGDMYFIRPEGYDAGGRAVRLWYEDAVTDDRHGTGEWETLTINLQRLTQLAGTNGISISDIDFPVARDASGGASIEFDWVCVHKGFLPNAEDMQSQETIFNNHLDDDGDSLVDRDDEADYSKKGFSKPLILAYYHPWFGSPNSASGVWSGWSGERMDFSDPDSPPKPMGVVYDPNKFDPQFAGKRVLSCPYYPLNFWDYPDYVPPADGKYRYDLYGGVEKTDNLSEEYVRKEIALAQKYGIDGFVIDTGGRGSFEDQIKTALSASLKQDQLFWQTIIYDWYYRLPAFNLMEAKSDQNIALDLLYMSSTYGDHPRYLRFDDRPVIFASFLSSLIELEKWLRVKEFSINPESASFGVAVNTGEIKQSFGNRIEFTFARAEQPGTTDKRYLSVAFDMIKFLNKNLKPVGIFDIGTPQARPHLLYGWSGDETWSPGQTMVWAAGTDRKAGLEIEIPPDAVFMEISCLSLPYQNSVTMKINNGSPVEFSVPKSYTTVLFRLKTDSQQVSGKSQKLPYALFLDSRDTAPYFDGFASYGSFMGSNRCIVSDPSPTILTVGCGYDDRKIRYPGNFTDRENGSFYRRQWETALEGKPDVILVNTWSEWGEGTNIAPTVEFGYKYLELTLTYSLIFRNKITASAKPSGLGLTIHRYEINEQNCSIRLSAEKQGKVTFRDLPISTETSMDWQVFKDSQPYKMFTVNMKDRLLSLDIQDSRSTYYIQGRRSSVAITCVKGDLDGDGKVGTKDAVLALRIAAGLIEPTRYQICAGDMNNDGKIGSNDAMIILRMSAGLSAPARQTSLQNTNYSFISTPEQTELLQNFPNPFNPETWIPYNLKEGSAVTIRIYRLTGELIRELNPGYKSAGIYASKDKAAYWDGCDEAGEHAASGVYFYSIKAGSFTSSRKMIITK